MDAFIAGDTSLKEIELQLLGSVEGKSILHLQCHFGQDTLSLQRMGARATGMDFSDLAIEKAQELNEKLGLEAQFVSCSLYELPKHLDKQFDIVYTSYGVIGWLPDINKWASVVERFLKPGGKFIMVEFHPVVWIFDDKFSKVEYRYFNSSAIEETVEGTYADRNVPIRQEYISWNHGLAEVVSSLLHRKLKLHSLNEYDYSPFDCFHGTVEVSPGKFRIEALEDKIPMVYSLVMEK
ncbi:MAG: class I SAM-dependent methyltransferase [Cyclobacteriaceae bacterium]